MKMPELSDSTVSLLGAFGNIAMHCNLNEPKHILGPEKQLDVLPIYFTVSTISAENVHIDKIASF
jgi:hypothetical protein